MNQDDDILNLPEPGRSWVVLHTRPRCEKKIADFCGRNSIPCYLPLRQKAHRYGSRERVFSSPLFPGYAFCAATVAQQATVRQNRHVANVLTVVDQATLVNQLRQIRQALVVGDVAEVMPYLEKGKPVRVTGGPFKGLEGIVARVKGKTRIVVNVDIIRQAVAVEVDSAFLAPA
jgi:transcription antitermination factor NusG